MSIYNPICPARGIHHHIERLEALRDQLAHVAQAVAAGNWLRRDALLAHLEALDQALIIESERARDELASVPAVSAEGATSQLISAMRDARSGEPDLQARAQRLIAQSVNFATV